MAAKGHTRRYRDLDDGGAPLTEDECKFLEKIRRELKAQITAWELNARVQQGHKFGEFAAGVAADRRERLRELDYRFVPEARD